MTLEMEAIKFKMNGFMNSFRDPYFIDYHRTLLFPPKTTIVGLLTNAMGLEEKDFFDRQDKMLVGIIIETFLSKGFDLWSVRKGKEKKEEVLTQPIHREFLFEPKFTVYVSADATLLDIAEDSLKMPKRYYNLGRDDEFVKIERDDIERLTLIKSEEREFRCVLPFDLYEYRYNLMICGNPITMPEVVKLPLRFEKVATGRAGREIKNFTQFCGVKIVLADKIQSLGHFEVVRVIEDKENLTMF